MFNVHQLRRHRAAAGVALLLVLVLQCFELHAELLFRSVEKVNGKSSWSPIKKYSNPADIAYARAAPGGAAVPAQDVRVFLSGEITRADVDSAGVMSGLLKSGKQRMMDNTMWLASNGGDIDAGMDLGRLLRKWGVFTVVAKNDQCLSACVFAFMGGERRSVAGKLGIHRPFFPFTQDTPDRPARFRHLQKTLKDFVEELDFPNSLYEAVMLVPPESMKILAPAELKMFYLEGISPSSEDMADAAAARRLNLPMYEYLKSKVSAPVCVFPAAGCQGKAQEVTASGGAADDPGSMQKPESAPAATATPAAPAVGRAAGKTQRLESPTGAKRGAPESS